MIGGASVNNRRRPRRGEEPDPAEGPIDEGASWWLYGEAQASHKGNFLNNTTRMQDWQIALFGGLKWRSFMISETPVLDLDSWLTVRGGEGDTTAVKIMQDL